MVIIGDLERVFAATIYPNRLLIAVVALAVIVAVAVVARRRRWDLAARRHPRTTIATLAVVLAVGLPIGWYLGSPLVLSKTIDEPPPVAAVEPSVSPTAMPNERPTRSTEPTAAPTASPTPTPVPLIERSGTFAGADDFHFGEGTARLIETAPGTFTVRLENFAVRNGPDLYVYLSPTADGYADEAIELGRLKADRGNQNYTVPAGVDVTDVASVVIWCKQFSVLFATAPLT